MTSGVERAITFRRATIADAALLAALAAAGFSDTFAADNDPRDMEAYLAAAFGEATQRVELADPDVTVLLAERDGQVVGYAMLVEGVGPPCVGGGSALEIGRLYAAKRWIGTGVGAALMQRCLDEAVARGRDTIWLGVWEHNRRAIAFYERWGFTDVGSQPFVLGRDVQTDRVMKRALREAS
jgi:diamine N-acetyltransferase